jgi:predicted MFS family arabinose efflux permease
MSELAAQPPRSAFPWYLTGTSFWLAGMSLQGFLITWLLVGELGAPADQVGLGRALMQIPGIAILIIGGILADRNDMRRLLLLLHLLIALPPLLLALLAGMSMLSVWLVIGFGICLSTLAGHQRPGQAVDAEPGEPDRSATYRHHHQPGQLTGRSRRRLDWADSSSRSASAPS